VNELHDLFADPRWFMCERRGREVKLGRCIGMQKANAEKERPDTPDPFPVCIGCEQGAWNRRFKGVWTDESPTLTDEKAMVTMEKPESSGLCEKCGEKPKFGRSPYCASCMARKSNEARKGKTTKKSTKSRKGRKKAGPAEKPEKSPPRGDTAVLKIDFGRKYAPILRQVECLADQEVRSVESQVIYMLKTSLRQLGETAQLSGP
jgi:hypothetical protein